MTIQEMLSDFQNQYKYHDISEHDFIYSVLALFNARPIDPNSKWALYCMANSIYKYGISQGKRLERQKKALQR